VLSCNRNLSRPPPPQAVEQPGICSREALLRNWKKISDIEILLIRLTALFCLLHTLYQIVKREIGF
jgi:hypothetical protein